MVLQRVVKPKNQRSKRFLENREPKVFENPKSCMLIRGGHTNQIINDVLKDLYSLKKPHGVLFKKKNIMRPFEDESSLEFLSQKNDCALFIFGSHSKKRPSNIVFGRMYDFHLLDMVEFGVEDFTPINAFKTMQCAYGTKPCLVFAGELFDQDPTWIRVKNLMIDVFRGEQANKIRLNGLEHVLSFTAVPPGGARAGSLLVRSYRVQLKKSGHRVPRVELAPMGPALDLRLRRTHLASDDLARKAARPPKVAKPKKTKNVSQDPFGSKLGRIHLGRQDLKTMPTRKFKGLKRTREEEAARKKAKKAKTSS